MEISDLDLSGSYMERMECMNEKMMDMLRYKTGLYGGNGIVDDIKSQVLKTYWEGMNRKFERMPTLMKQYMDGDDGVLDTIIDTISDINGYSIMSLVDISYHASSESK